MNMIDAMITILHPPESKVKKINCNRLYTVIEESLEKYYNHF